MVEDASDVGVVVEEDEQERDFNESVEEWAKGEISYELLVEKMPDRERPVSNRLTDFLLSVYRRIKK